MSLARSRETRELAVDEAQGQPMHCTFCSRMTPHETLRIFGARCLGCYRAYCEAPRTSPDTGNKVAGPKAWAWALRHREVTGDRLTSPQRKAWREALKVELAAEEA